MEPGASSNPPDPRWDILFVVFVVEGTHSSFKPMCLLFLNRYTRPGQQLEAAQWQHADLCKNVSGKAVTLHTILLGVSGICRTEHTLNQFKQLGLDHQHAIKLACKLHAQSVMSANKLATARRAIGKQQYFSQSGSGASCYFQFSNLVVEGTHG
eukprot:163068-Pelagomonas_calceolata.AAC.1